MQEIVPWLEPHPGRLPERLAAEGPRRAKVALLVGCAADAFYPRTTWATARVLQKNGCEVWVPRGQGCCGALHYHAGLVAPAQELALVNCQAFDPNEVDAIITNAGGCGPVLKEYGHLLRTEPVPGSPATFPDIVQEVAKNFAAKVRDVHEFLAELGPIAPTHPVPVRAVYHDACGLSHGQKIRSQPRQLLGMIPGLELVPLPESEACCGAAGSYNVTQPEMAEQVGRRKALNILATGARAVFAGNVGCLLQIDRRLRAEGANLWVAHPIDALWASYSGELPGALRGERRA
jgi:glycolate oxidase iron-sulfur subunit